jgi:hypothetical protein
MVRTQAHGDRRSGGSRRLNPRVSFMPKAPKPEAVQRPTFALRFEFAVTLAFGNGKLPSKPNVCATLVKRARDMFGGMTDDQLLKAMTSYRTDVEDPKRTFLVDECTRLRVITRMNDANGSTSTEEEFGSLLKGHPPFDEMSDEMLRSELLAARAECKELGEE